MSAWLVASGPAKTWNAQENTAYFGTLNQHSLEYSYPNLGTGNHNMACGPAAGINSVAYLQNAFPSVYGHSLIMTAGKDMDHNGSYTSYDDLIYTAGGGLAQPNCMNSNANGTPDDVFVWGQYLYVESHCPGKTIYAAEDCWAPASWGTTPPAPSPPPSWVYGQVPSWHFLYHELHLSAAVEVQLQFTDDSHLGHYVSATGMTWDDVLNTGTLSFMNPADGAFESTNIRQLNGAIYTDFHGSNGSWIGEMNAIVPIPEPASILLVLTLLPALAWHLRRRRNGGE